ncbi:MAG TPA: hypothetical protein VKP67_02930 [Xanthobacteraceae bacterium]|nr:hypothetical protein [Xanthobacteraceae bacterium]
MAERTKAGLPRWIDPKQGGRDVVPHGFRSSFKDWSSECTKFRSEIAEAALAHKEADKVKAAYGRATFDKLRRDLLAAWAGHCGRYTKLIQLRTKYPERSRAVMQLRKTFRDRPDNIVMLRSGEGAG